MRLQITYSGQEKGMATIDAQDPRNQVPRAHIAHVIQMNLDSPNKLHAAFKQAIGALLVTDNKEFLDVGILRYISDQPQEKLVIGFRLQLTRRGEYDNLSACLNLPCKLSPCPDGGK